MVSVSAVVLAAGESKRMKMPKLVLPYRGKTIIETVICNIRQSAVRDIYVVLGGWEEEIRKVIGGMDVNICVNSDFRKGMLSSVICGIRNLPAGADAALVFPGDQPAIMPGTTDLIIEAFRESGKGIVIPVFEGRKGHPLLIARKYFHEVEKLDPARGLRALHEGNRDDIMLVSAGNENILLDIDTMDDYLKATN